MVESVKKICTIGAIIFTNLVDLGTTTILFCHGNDCYKYYTNDVYGYQFGTSIFDLWVFSLFRVSLLLGTCVAIIYSPQSSIERIQKVQYRTTIILIAVAMWTVTLVKLLVHSDSNTDFQKPWFWSIFGFTLLCTIMFYTQWVILGNIAPPQSRLAKINKTDPERQPLLGNSTSTHIDDVSPNNNDEKKVKESFSAVGRLLSMSKKDWFILLPAFIFLCVAAVSEIFVPFYTGKVIDGIAIEKDKEKFTSAIVTMSLLSVASSIAAGLRGGLFKVAKARLDIRIRNSLFSSLLHQEVAFFDTVRTGDMTSRLTSDTSTMTLALGTNTNIFLRNLVKAIGVCIFMFKLSWRLSMVTFIGLPIITAVSAVYGDYYEKLSKQVQESLAKANEVAEETCSSIKTVRSFANEMNEIDRYADKLKVTFKIRLKEAITYAGYVWNNKLFALGLVVATLYYGGHLVIDDVITGGTLVSFILYQSGAWCCN
ncbi:unnamed protein product [Owenia fusiformis]|uniref:ABC transmembrane type-1 domain-containing protein n=1 Tax=Owenia fusiformis TaxID=6347 RepID=A0A8S4Q5V5_OWEFU|nr:unnamed protein product [Owenia fusiformis]